MSFNKECAGAIYSNGVWDHDYDCEFCENRIKVAKRHNHEVRTYPDGRTAVRISCDEKCKDIKP